MRKIWIALMAQFAKIGRMFWSMDPVAILQHQCDVAAEQIKVGTEGLAKHRAHVDGHKRRVAAKRAEVDQVTAKINALIASGQQEAAAKYALELQGLTQALRDYEEQGKTHEETYQNNLRKIKHGQAQIAEARSKAQELDAELKMAKADAAISEITNFDVVNVSSDFGEVVSEIQSQIDTHRGKAKVAADLSTNGIAEIEQDESVKAALAAKALEDFQKGTGVFNTSAWDQTKNDDIKQKMITESQTVAETPQATTTPSK